MGRSQRRPVRPAAALVALLLAFVTLPLAGGPAAADPGLWTASGDGASVASDGSETPAQLVYDVREVSSGQWTFSTTAAADGTVTLPWQWQGFHAYFQVQASLRAFVDHGDEWVESQVLLDAGPQDCCTTPSSGFSYSGNATFTVRAGETFGFDLRGSHNDSTRILSGTFTVSPQTADEQNTTWPAARVLSGSATAAGTLRLPGQARWFRFPVQPDSVVQVDVDGLPADYDLTLFRDIGQAFDAVTSVGDLALVNAEFAADAFSPSVFSPSVFSPSVFSPSVFSPSVFSPSVFSPSVFSPSVFSPSVFSPSVFSPATALVDTLDPATLAASGLTPEQLAQAFSSAQTRSLVAVSARDGTAPESIRASTWNADGYFYARVQGRNGAFDPTAPFALRVTTSGGTCGVPLDTFLEQETLRGDGERSPRTVVLTDSARMPGTLTQVRAMQADLAAFAARPEVDAVVVDAAQVPRLRALNDQADRFVDCPYAKNLVAAELRDVVNSYRSVAPGGDQQDETLRYVVLVGDDSVIPFVRVADSAGLGPEQDYVPPVAEGTSSQSALRRNQVLSQDPYGARVDITLKGATVPVPDLAVGRLVESTDEVRAALARYVALDGVLPRPTSSLVTGYDFLTDAADDVAAQLRTALGAGAGTTELITDRGVPTSQTTVGGVPSRRTSWTADDLRAALRARPHDVVYLAGHFSANSALAADDRSTVVTTELAGSDVDLTDALVLSAGCHSGYSIVDGHGVPGVTLGLDWTQLMARKGATFVAGTGYQYGDTDFLEYSERLYAALVSQLRVGTGPVPVGLALTRAKQEYLAGTSVLTGIHQKALVQATLYGLPMTGVDLPAGRTDPPVAQAVSPEPVTTDPGATLRLAALDLSEATPTTVSTKPDPGRPGGVFTWWQGRDGVLTNPGQPALPLHTVDVGVPDAAVRGVLLLGASYRHSVGAVPLTGAAVTEYGTTNPPFASTAFVPRRLATANGLAQVAGDGGTRLFLTPAQYVTGPAGAGTATVRLYDRLDVRVLYSGNTSSYGGNVPALAAPPSVTDVRSTVEGAVAAGARVLVQARVVGDPSAGIQEVYTTWTASAGPAFGTLASVRMSQDPADSTLWTAVVELAPGQDPADVRFVVQAVNGVGLVTVEDNRSQEYAPGRAPGLDPPPGGRSASTLTLQAPAGGTLGGDVDVSATLVAGDPRAGRGVSFWLGSRTVTALTDDAGVARATLPLVEGVGPVRVGADFAGDDVAEPSSAGADLVVGLRASAIAIASLAPRVLAGTDPLVTATLTSGGVPVPERAVYLVVSKAGRTLSTTLVRTDQEGRARLVRTDLPLGAVQVSAYAARPDVPLPDGGTVDGSDPELAPAAVASTTLNVAYYAFGPFGAPLVDGPGPVANPEPTPLPRTATVPVRVQLLRAGGVPVSDSQGAALARTCQVALHAQSGPSTRVRTCLTYDKRVDTFVGSVSGRALGWKRGHVYQLRVELRRWPDPVQSLRVVSVRAT